MHHLHLFIFDRGNWDLGDLKTSIPSMNISCVSLIIFVMDQSISVIFFLKKMWPRYAVTKGGTQPIT